MAGNNRSEKLGRQIQRDISDILQREDLGMPKGELVTVTGVRLTSDLKIAKVYFSIFPTEKSEETMAKLAENNKQIRFLLGKKLKNQVREIPEIQFFKDDSLDYIDRIDNLLKD